MGIMRIFSSGDTWITDERPGDSNSLTLRASGSDHGRSPALNVFAKKDEIVSGSVELARSLIRFDLTELSGMVFTDLTIPSGSATYNLKMFNQEHEDTVPSSYDLFVFPVSRSWDEGLGIDDDNHSDEGYASWLNATSTAAWDVTGSDYVSGSTGLLSASQHFDAGTEDFEVDITPVVNEWLSGTTVSNNGLVVKLGSVEETGSVNYYRKSFHSRESLFVDKLPYIEVRWDDVTKDNRSNFAYGQSNSLYLYNFVRGALTDLTEPITVTIRDNAIDASASYNQDFAASKISTGIYGITSTIENTASFSASWNDVWTSGSVVYMTGSFSPVSLTGSSSDINEQYVIAPRGLKRVYREAEEARISVNVRKRDFVTHRGIVATASLDPETEQIETMYYSVINNETGEVVIPFGTGSVPYTQLSYDANGNFFDLKMRTFVPGFKYEIIFLLDINNDQQVISDEFTFKVV